MPDFVAIAKTTDLPDPGKQIFELDEHIVVLFHVGGQFYCLEDLCTHDGGTLADGELCDDEIACPRHGAKFDIKSGKAISMPATEPTISHEVKIEGDSVLVRLNED